MSMYGAMFPDEYRAQRVGYLLDAIGQPGVVLMNLRLRDAWVEKDGDQPVICLYTRNGGGNRECFCGHDLHGTCIGCHGHQATLHPAYLSDADDEFDETYRTYRFKAASPKVDDEVRRLLLEVALDEPRDMSAEWLRVIEVLGG